MVGWDQDMLLPTAYMNIWFDIERKQNAIKVHDEQIGQLQSIPNLKNITSHIL